MADLIDRIKGNMSERLRLARNKNRLEDFLGKNCGFSICARILGERAYANNNYLIKNLCKNNDICDLLYNEGEIKDNLYKKLVKMPHTYRKKSMPYSNPKSVFQYSEEPDNVNGLNPSQLLRVWIIMESLEKQEFVNHVGRLIEDNLKDPYTEHGGLVLFGNDMLKLYNVESRFAKKKDIRYKGTYKMPFKASSIQNIAKYHFHASKEDCSEYAGPSQGFPLIGGDLASALCETILDNESHHVIATKLNGQRFNIDYFGCEAVWNNNQKKGNTAEYPQIVLDLGNYEYGK